ncbi:metalloprotease 1 precursor [Patellaria atrata CBS 101060]|uniref:Metalloprotease 1 n=1 Tax=Patellaria atrata CBS 101060 TaxID=1346257 RepID=A0A9P4VRU6_9PEZI|nr:metalloprotease 1 precursor [Patellaria atrata CBS 101060]
MRAFISGLVLATLASAAPHTAPRDVSKFGCATEPTKEFLAVAAKMHQAEVSGKMSSIQATINVPTYFHVVAASTSVADGYISDATLQQQLAVMNSNYAPYGIAFQLAGTDRTINSQWANDNNEMAMKRALRKGTYSSLNVYFQKSLGGNLGYCYFPTNASPGSTAYIQDGCTVLAASVPGGSATNYNQGKTATHEIGHWFGLLHTFQGGCSGSGDSVADTPAQSSPTSGCPEGRDSCPNNAGLDPIHNYMDYSYDSCYREFTPGQQTRAYNMYNQYRAGK